MGSCPFSLSCLLFSTPCQASHACSLCCSSLTLICLHLYCSPSLLCAFLFCPSPALPHTLSCPVSLIHLTPCCPACSQPCCSPAHIAYLTFLPPPHTHADVLPSIFCAPPSIYKHTQGQNCTNLGILALVSLPVKLLFLHIRPRQECRDIYETLFNVLKSHRLEHLGN